MRSSGSRPTVGSSKMRNSGSPSRACAIPHSLALASGESADSGPALLLQIDGPDDLVDGGAVVPQPLQGSHVVQELIDGELVIQAEGLGR